MTAESGEGTFGPVYRQERIPHGLAPVFPLFSSQKAGVAAFAGNCALRYRLVFGYIPRAFRSG
jgi:hypothetical protein